LATMETSKEATNPKEETHIAMVDASPSYYFDNHDHILCKVLWGDKRDVEGCMTMSSETAIDGTRGVDETLDPQWGETNMHMRLLELFIIEDMALTSSTSSLKVGRLKIFDKRRQLK
jgi:hypothetical protein